MIDSLCRKYGSPLSPLPSLKALKSPDEETGVGEAFFTFPTLEQLSKATESQLRDIGFGYRAK